MGSDGDEPDAQRLTIPKGTIHVWTASLDTNSSRVSKLAGILSADESERADRFVFLQDRNRFVTGRAFLRLLLGQYLDQPPNSLRFRYGPFGKPDLAGAGRNISFNLAHADQLAICALVNDGNIGVDIERIRVLPDALDIARRFFSPQEIADLSTLPEPLHLRGFFKIWTCKEAFLKATGAGLNRPLDEFTVTLNPGQRARIRLKAADPDEVDPCSLYTLEPQPDFVAAIALPGHDRQLQHRQWSWNEAPTVK
jgi:4'-phosphopantetheinyl transferase